MNKATEYATGPSRGEGRVGHSPDDCSNLCGRTDVGLLFARLIALREESPERRCLRNRLVELHLQVAEQVARDFRGRGEPLDDLYQTAVVGLIQAVDRFDPQRGVDFRAFAVPTIRGVIKRHFRDNAWLLHVPRRLKQLHLVLNAGHAELLQVLGRSPGPTELAAYVRAPEDDVVEALKVANAYVALSLDVGGLDGDSGTSASSFAESIPDDGGWREVVECRESLHPLLDQLSPREKRILFLRFFANQTQAQIADELGLSQAYVSRLLSSVLSGLRSCVLHDQVVSK